MVKCEIEPPKTGLNPNRAPADGCSKTTYHSVSSIPYVHCIRTFVMPWSELADFSERQGWLLFDSMISLCLHLFHPLGRTSILKDWQCMSLECSLTTHECMIVSECVCYFYTSGCFWISLVIYFSVDYVIPYCTTVLNGGFNTCIRLHRNVINN